MEALYMCKCTHIKKRPFTRWKVDASSTFQSPLFFHRWGRRLAFFILRRALTAGGWLRLTTTGTNHCTPACGGGVELLWVWYNKTKSKQIPAVMDIDELCRAVNISLTKTIHYTHTLCLSYINKTPPPFALVRLFLSQARSDTASLRKLRSCISKPIGKLLQPLKSNLQILWFSSQSFTFLVPDCMSLQTTGCSHSEVCRNRLKELSNTLEDYGSVLCMF